MADWVNEWTEAIVPDRVRNVPRIVRAKAVITSTKFHACSAPAPHLHQSRMEERGGHQPRHERCVLNRVPGPVATPRQHLVGPPATEGDAKGQKRPGHQSRTAAPAQPLHARAARGRGPRSRRRTGPSGRRTRGRASGGWIAMRMWFCSRGLGPGPSGGA